MEAWQRLTTPRATSGASPRGITVAILLLFSAAAGWYGLKHPQHSWDTVPYVALVLSHDGLSGETLHRETYERLQASLPGDYYQGLVSAYPLRREVSASPQELERVLPFWSIKPLYVWSAYGLYKAGVDVVEATTLVSTISTVILTLLLGAWLLRYFTDAAALVLTGAVFFGAGAHHLLGLARPDALSALLLFLAVFVLAEFRYTGFACVVAVIAVLARPDNVVIASLICLYIAAATPGDSVKRDRITGTLSLIAAVLIYVIVQQVTGAYGWKTTFVFSFSPPASLSLLTDGTVTPSSYLKALYSSLRAGATTLPFLLFVLFSAIAVTTAWRPSHRHSPKGHLLLILVIAIGIHWLVFPNFAMVFFVAYYLAIASIALTVTQRRPERIARAR